MSSPELQSRRKLLGGTNEPTASTGLLALPLNLLAASLRPLHPLLPYLFPVLVCLLCIPILMFFSGAAGWVVWRNVPVGWSTDVYLHYGDALNPFANEQLPRVMADQPYDISLHLVLPATESNFALGNFMATLKFTTAYNESIATVRRSAALVPPRISLLKQSILGSPSTTEVDIHLLSQFTFGTSTVNARLELGRSDGWRSIGNGQGRELSVLEATLKGIVRPRGIRAILARYPRLTTFLSTFMFFFISLTVVSGFLFWSIGPSSSSTKPLSPSESSKSDFEDGHDPTRPFPDVRHISRHRHHRRDSESGSSAPEDEIKHNGDSSNGVRVLGLRKRRSHAFLESQDISPLPKLLKTEEDGFDSLSSLARQPQVISSIPHSSSNGNNESSQQQIPTTDFAPPFEADIKSQ